MTRKATALFVFVLLDGCVNFNPGPLKAVGFEHRAQSKKEGGVEISVVALTESETRDATDVDLAREGIQPVWVKVQNRESTGFVLPPIVIDPE